MGKQTKSRIIGYISGVAVVCLLVGLLVILVASADACKARKEEEKKQEIESLELNVPSSVGREGFLAVDSKGSVIDRANADLDAVRVEFVFDLHCGGCRQVETEISDSLRALMESGEAQIYFTPVSFMNRASTDDYSARAASTLMVVAEEEPEKFFSYLNALYASFPPEGPGYPKAGVSYEQLASTAVDAGVSKSTADKFSEQTYRLWAQENTEVVQARTDIFPDGISTPSIFVGGKLNESGVLEGSTKLQFNANSDIDSQFRNQYETISGKRFPEG